MQKKSQLLWSCVAGCAALVVVSGANAASRSMTAGGTTTARMPTMPTMSINTIGTHAVSGVGTPTGGNGGVVTGGGNVNPNPNPNPDPNPTPTPTDCEDGGVANSEFTVDDCMQSMLNCVQSGVLPNGLNDLFNEDLRNSIINGMGICASQVDYCIRNVRVDCHNVYDSSVDVWLDFNSRIVQPEYYNFVLRKTGLTPNQAENVCELLDKNTYGKSFAAVSASGNVTSEYNNKVGAYNEQNNGTLSKNQPQGPMVNSTNNGNLTGVDGERGHYARWDATNGVCKVRVAAYNKDKMITNKWLFGAIGDDRAAEVWQDAGSSFVCNKDLFDFSLMNTTKTVAATALPGGAIVGAGIGALAGHGAREFDCSNDSARKELADQIEQGRYAARINKYLSEPISTTVLSIEQCEKIQDLYDRYMTSKRAYDLCVMPNCQVIKDNVVVQLDTCSKLNNVVIDGQNNVTYLDGNGSVPVTVADADALENLKVCVKGCQVQGAKKPQCSFRSLESVDISDVESAICNGTAGECVSAGRMKADIDELGGVFNKLTVLFGEKSNRVKTTAIGAGIGLGTGGVATAITAFVERNNISCRVGDGLDTVGFGKSYTIDSLKDFYVKWNLRVADSISPTARVTSCEDWIATCGMYTTEEDCNAVEINYQRPGRNTTTLVRSACRMSGSVCIENRSVAVSYGACERNFRPITPIGPVGPVGPGTDVPVVIQH